MKHKVEIIMLPAKQEGKKQSYSSGVYFDGNKYTRFNTTNSKCREQHLYAVVSQDVEPIKESDWFLNEMKSLFKADANYIANSAKENMSAHRKIIATTDPKLRIKTGEPYMSQDLMKIIVHPDKKIPQLQQSFLKEFVANPDGKWEVEYEEIIRCYNCNKLEEDCINTSTNCIGYFEGNDKLKLNQDNTVNITPVEEKMYTREEIIAFALKAWNQGERQHLNHMFFNDWIKENL